MVIDDVAEYEEKDSELAKYTISSLHAEIRELNDSITWWVNRYNSAYNQINHLTAESTKWESKFYDEAKKVDKAQEYIDFVWNNTKMPVNTIVTLRTLDNILKGENE